MKLGLVLLPFIVTSAFAQSNCVRTRGSYGELSEKPSTCLDTNSLQEVLHKRAVNESSQDLFRAGLEEFPGMGFFATVMDQGGKYDDLTPYMDRQVTAELDRVLNNYSNSIYYEANSDNPESHYQAVVAFTNYGLELEKLKQLKHLKQEDIDKITNRIHQIVQTGNIFKAKLDADLANVNKAKQEKIIAGMNALSAKMEGLVSKNDFAKYLTQLELMGKELESINAKISQIQSEAAEKEKLEKLKEEKRQIEAAIAMKAEQTIKDIQNYTKFAQGMIAIYSLFNPEDAGRISNAVSGMSQIAIAASALSSLPAGAPTSVAFGHYGMMAMGAVQLMNSFSSNNSSNDVFKALFKQLQQISRQITELQKRIDSQFHNLEGSLLQVEQNIIKRLEDIGHQIRDLKEMSEYSISVLNEINEDLKAFSNYTVNRDISLEVKTSYLTIVERCLGKSKLSVKLKKKELISCLDDFNSWMNESLSSRLMTRRLLDGQYEGRSHFEWQINDFADHYSRLSSGTIDYKLVNPYLLKDLSDNLKFLKKLNPKLMNDEVLSHPVFENVRREEKNLEGFQKSISQNTDILLKLKEEYKTSLLEVHSSIATIKKNQDLKVMDHHRKELVAFKKSLESEIIKRGNPAESDDIITLNVIKDSLNSAEQLEYKRDPFKMIEEGKVVLFARACQLNDPYDTLIPINFNYLKSTLGEDLAKRFIANPQMSSICFSVKTEKQKVLYKQTAMIRFSEIEKYKKVVNTVHVSDDFKIGGPVIIKDRIITQVGKYKGDFISSFTIRGSFDSKEILHETFNLDERMPLRNGVTDKLGLLTLLKGVRYSRKFVPGTVWTHHIMKDSQRITYPKDIVESGLTPSQSLEKEMAQNNGGLLMTTNKHSTSQDVLNLRNHEKKLNHADLFEKDKRMHDAVIVKEVDSFMESTLKTDRLDKAGKVLAGHMFFSGASEKSDILRNHLSEIWGLRSGPYLKQLYLEVLKTDSSSTSLNFVLENQLKHLEAIK